MADSKLRDLSTDFAVKVIKLCDSVKGLSMIIIVGVLTEMQKNEKSKYCF